MKNQSSASVAPFFTTLQTGHESRKTSGTSTDAGTAASPRTNSSNCSTCTPLSPSLPPSIPRSGSTIPHLRLRFPSATRSSPRSPPPRQILDLDSLHEGAELRRLRDRFFFLLQQRFAFLHQNRHLMLPLLLHSRSQSLVLFKIRMIIIID